MMKKVMKETVLICSNMSNITTGKTYLIPLSTNPTKWPNTLKQFVSNLTTNCLSMFDHFVKLALKELRFKYVFCLV